MLHYLLSFQIILINSEEDNRIFKDDKEKEVGFLVDYTEMKSYKTILSKIIMIFGDVVIIIKEKRAKLKVS